MASVDIKNYIQRVKCCCPICGKQVYHYENYEWSKVKGTSFVVIHKQCIEKRCLSCNYSRNMYPPKTKSA